MIKKYLFVLTSILFLSSCCYKISQNPDVTICGITAPDGAAICTKECKAEMMLTEEQKTRKCIIYGTMIGQPERTYMLCECFVKCPKK